MKIIFFEIQPWEEEKLKQAFPDAAFVKDKLAIENIEQYQDAEIISTFIYSSISRAVLNKLPNLKYIVTRSTGFDHIDGSAAHEKNIVIANVPEYGSRTVAEHTFALILALTRKIYQSINKVKHFDFNRDDIRGIDLFGKTMGIVGLGKTGIEVLKIARAFGLKVLVTTRTQDPHLAIEYGFDYVDLANLLSQSDIISLHVPYSKETHHLINIGNIADIKKGAYLINTSRGGLIETQAILKGLEENILKGVGLDVLEEEKELGDELEILKDGKESDTDLKTLIYNHVLINHLNVIITPHNAFNSVEALEKITQVTIENIRAILSNHLQNIVS